MGRAKGRAVQGTLWKERTRHTQKWESVYPQLRKVQEKARASKKEQFTSLAHYLKVPLLEGAFRRLDAKASPGIDGVKKKKYGQNIKENLCGLHESLKTMSYRASPVKRVWIDKAGGGKRPLGLPTTEDKIVQWAVVEILNCIYEEDFLGCSYGFRPGRNQHQALRALQTVLQKGRVNWVLDADLSKFFDSIDHKELMAVIEHRVKDRNILRLIGKWLSAGIVEIDGRRVRTKVGTPQGGVISPLLANIFLHHVLDTFVYDWRQKKAIGEVYIVRYADDFVICFEREDDAHVLLKTLTERFSSYKLTLNPDKTHLVRFGRQSGGPGGGKSGTFDFLGFTHIAGKDRYGRYLAQRRTSRNSFRKSVKAVHEWCKVNRHQPVSWQYRELSLKLRGHYEYYGIRGNYDALSRFRQRVWELWRQALMRRSQKVNHNRLYALTVETFKLPLPRITHSEGWLPVNPGYLLGRAGCGNAARPVL
jgi:group II intron reverse transcriptase/maturase